MYEGFMVGYDGTEISFREYGNPEGPALILSDGIGCDGYAWTYLIPYFEREYRIIHWHYRGHGRSHMPKDMHKVGIDDLVRDLHLLQEKLQTGPAVHVGHSMGVQVILEHWNMYPDDVQGLIPVCGSYGHPLNTFQDNPIPAKIWPYLSKAALRFVKPVEWIWHRVVPTDFALQVGLHVEANPAFIDRRVFRNYFDHIGNISVELFVRMLQHAQEHDAFPFLSKIDKPVLILGGTNDSFTPVWLSERMAREIPDADLLILRHATHTMPIEFPELMNLRIEKYLKERAYPNGRIPKMLPTPEAEVPTPAKERPKEPTVDVPKTAETPVVTLAKEPEKKPSKKASKKPASTTVRPPEQLKIKGEKPKASEKKVAAKDAQAKKDTAKPIKKEKEKAKDEKPASKDKAVPAKKPAPVKDKKSTPKDKSETKPKAKAKGTKPPSIIDAVMGDFREDS